MKYLLLLTAGLVLSLLAYTQGCTGNYVDPTFQLKTTDPTCLTNSGSIEAISLQGGVAPFSFRLVEINTTNSTGIFNNLSAGLYTMEFKDACGTVRTRQATLVPYSFSFDFTIDKTSDCNDGIITISTNPENALYKYGVANPNGDTVWSTGKNFDIKLSKTLTIIVKDACGNAQVKYWVAPPLFLPYIDQIQHNLQCDKFDLFPVYYGFDNPKVCLYEYGTDKLVDCKDAPAITNFFNIPWGDYYIIVEDKCHRDSMFKPNQQSFGGSQIDPYNWNCTTFTMHVDGMEDTVCLYDAVTDKLISCKGQDTVSLNPRTGTPWPSGAVWENLPYGSYYAWIYDPCMDTTFKIDSTVFYPFGFSSGLASNCTMNQTAVQTWFDPGTKGPYNVKVLYPDGTVALNETFTQTYRYLLYNTWPQAGVLTVIASDACGHVDTTYLQQEQILPVRTHEMRGGCPGTAGSSGSGDIILKGNFNAYNGAVVRIIKRNSTDTIVNMSFQTNNSSLNLAEYTFANLPTGVYIVESSVGCGYKVYDTVEIKPYVYPVTATLQTNQCGGNQFSFATPVKGGLSPYTFQIIGQTPTLPTLSSIIQSDSSFTISTGYSYESIKIRTIDKCGNSAINDVQVVQFAGCDMVLQVDSVQRNRAINNKLATVYPNPSEDYFMISFSQRKKTDYRVEVINTSGVKVYEKAFYNVDKGDFRITSAFVPGFYIINVYDIKTGRSSSLKQIVR